MDLVLFVSLNLTLWIVFSFGANNCLHEEYTLSNIKYSLHSSRLSICRGDFFVHKHHPKQYSQNNTLYNSYNLKEKIIYSLDHDLPLRCTSHLLLSNLCNKMYISLIFHHKSYNLHQHVHTYHPLDSILDNMYYKNRWQSSYSLDLEEHLKHKLLYVIRTQCNKLYTNPLNCISDIKEKQVNIFLSLTHNIYWHIQSTQNHHIEDNSDP